MEVVGRRRRELEGLKSWIDTGSNSREQLDWDLGYILHGRPMRRYGEIVDGGEGEGGNFRRIAPGEMYQSIIKTVQQYRLSSV